jgi:hypothetical protein
LTFFVKEGSIVCPAVTGNQVITIGFQPQTILFWQTHQTATGDVADSWWCFGGYAGAGSNPNASAYSSQTNNAASSSLVNTVFSNTRCTGIVFPGSAAIASGAAVVGTSSTGFTLSWTTVTSGDLIHYLAIGGTEISSTGNTISPRTTAGTQAITGLSFQPKLVLFFYGNNATTGGGSGYGVATSSTSRWACSMSQAANVTMSSSVLVSRIQHQTACIALLNNGGATTLLARADLVSMNTDGFTLNWTTATATAFSLSYIAIGGTGQFATGTVTKAANTSATTETVNAGFATAPGAYMMFNNATTNETGQSTGWRSSIGATDGTAANAACWENKNGVINTQARKYSDSGSNALNSVMRMRALPASVSAAGATEIELDHGSFTASGFTLNYATNAVTTQYIYPWIAFGGAPITEPANPTLGGPVDAFA